MAGDGAGAAGDAPAVEGRRGGAGGVVAAAAAAVEMEEADGRRGCEGGGEVAAARLVELLEGVPVGDTTMPPPRERAKREGGT